MSVILTRWVYPAHYAGADWSDYYVIAAQHRDSDILTRCNFQVASESLESIADTQQAFDDAGDSHVQIARASHWAVGWCETLLLHHAAHPALIAEAERMARAMESYPVLDEDKYCEMEEKEANEAWENYSLRDRIELCSRAGISIFHARHPYPPSDDSGYVRERLLGY